MKNKLKIWWNETNTEGVSPKSAFQVFVFFVVPFLMSIILLGSCDQQRLPEKHRAISVSIHNGFGFSESICIFECDSLAMSDGQHADA